MRSAISFHVFLEKTRRFISSFLVSFLVFFFFFKLQTADAGTCILRPPSESQAALLIYLSSFIAQHSIQNEPSVIRAFQSISRIYWAWCSSVQILTDCPGRDNLQLQFLTFAFIRVSTRTVVIVVLIRSRCPNLLFLAQHSMKKKKKTPRFFLYVKYCKELL